MQLRLFGGFSLHDENGTEVDLNLRRARALLAYLALKQTRSESREVLVDLLWPDRFKPQAQASLRQVLFELRRAAPDQTPIVEATRADVALGPVIDMCDVWAFEHLAASDEAGDADRLLRIYSGPFLDGPGLGPEPFEQWVILQRARLENHLERAVLHVATVHSDDERCTGILDRLVQLSPMCSQAVLRLMELAAAGNRVAEALRHYERYAHRLKLEFDETPPAELQDAYATLRTTPAVPRRFARIRRRPAFARTDPWRPSDLDAPVLAVLPFRYEGARHEGDALALGLGEDVTLMLSGCRWFSVLSRSATHSLRTNAPFIPTDFARRVGADYLIYGTLTDRADAWSVVIELADGESGHIAWAKRFEADDAELVAWGGELCPLIVAALDPAVAESEHKTLSRPVLSATGSVPAYHQLVRGYRHFYAGDWPKAAAAFRQAIREDATYAHAYAMLALTSYNQAQIDRGAGWDDDLASAERDARRSLEIDPSEPKGCAMLGQALAWQGRHAEACPHLERAVNLNPSFAQASSSRSFHAVMTGDFAKAKSLLVAAMRLRVGDASLGLCLPAKILADLHLGNRNEALTTAHWATRLQPHFWLTRQAFAAALWSAGDTAAANDVVTALRADYPHLTSDEFANWMPYADRRYGAPVERALQGAGWH